MKHPSTFIDTSGFFALLVSNDDYHKTASNYLKSAQTKQIPLCTTDYVLDETFTLLKARKVTSQIKLLNETLANSKVVKIHWMDPDFFDTATTFFIKHQDKDYSFTDCVSFCLMKRLKITSALTRDHHFEQAGFKIV